jgi:hypothetical protein
MNFAKTMGLIRMELLPKSLPCDARINREGATIEYKITEHPPLSVKAGITLTGNSDLQLELVKLGRDDRSKLKRLDSFTLRFPLNSSPTSSDEALVSIDKCLLKVSPTGRELNLFYSFSIRTGILGLFVGRDDSSDAIFVSLDENKIEKADFKCGVDSEAQPLMPAVRTVDDVTCVEITGVQLEPIRAAYDLPSDLTAFRIYAPIFHNDLDIPDVLAQPVRTLEWGAKLYLETVSGNSLTPVRLADVGMTFFAHPLKTSEQARE